MANDSKLKKVSIYSTPTCTYCKMAKDLFSANNVAFEEFNVASDLQKRQEMVQKSGQMGVPVITIDDEVIIGFDRSRLTKTLGIA
jgi:glutaredoxin 3